MTNLDKVMSNLSSAELCDDCLSVASGVRPRQTVYAICRELSGADIIARRTGKCEGCRKIKLVSSLSNAQRVHSEITTSTSSAIAAEIGPVEWYWEGNVQAKVVSYLDGKGYIIRRVADTASRESGKDIIAVGSDGSELWVSVKGYPQKSANVQARHWFSGAIFDLVLYRGESPNTKLALALPDGFTTYANLLPRIDWLKQFMKFNVYWVHENGSIRIQ